MLLAAVLAS
ncbi:hypothetical protein YPPY93_1528, partial [Yersinia pestis PY-93]